MKAGEQKGKPRGFKDYLDAQRRAKCVVCQKVPEALRREIRDITINQRYGATTPTVLEWLKVDRGIAITLDQWRSHSHAGHKP